MSNILEYKGYLSRIEYSMEDNVLHGKIEGIADLVTFESEIASEIEKEFREAVDDYLIFCEEIGKEPEKAYKGSFNVRVSPELHKKLVQEAYRQGTTLNQHVQTLLESGIDSKPLSNINKLCDQWVKITNDTLEMWSAYHDKIAARQSHSTRSVKSIPFPYQYKGVFC